MVSIKRCANCGENIKAKANFCPFCGAECLQTIHAKRDYKKILTIACIVLLALIVVFVAYTIINSLLLQNDATNSKLTMGLELSGQVVNGKDSDMGNLTENIMTGGYILDVHGNLYSARTDGLYCNTDMIKKGSFKGISEYKHDIYCIDIRNNTIVKFKDEIEEFYKFDKSKKITNLSIYKDNLYIVCIANKNVEFIRISLANKEYSLLGTFIGSKCWMNIDKDFVRLCVVDGSTWNVKQTHLDGDINFEESMRGSNNITHVGFIDSSIIIAEKGTSNIFQLDASGNRREIQLRLDPITNMIISGHTIVICTKANKYYWFNNDVAITHEITEQVKMGSNTLISFGFANKKLILMCEKGIIKQYDFNSENCSEIE